MDDDLKRLESKLDKVADEISQINVTMCVNTTVLDEHQKRTTQLEGRVEPIEKHIHEMVGVVKFLKILGVIAAIAETIHLFMH